MYGIDLSQLMIASQYSTWLNTWLQGVVNDVEKGEIASSICLQGILTEFLTQGTLQIDWMGILEEYLQSEDGHPMAYSKQFGKRLYKYDNQWLQSPIHAIHTRWWIEKSVNKDVDHEFFSDLIESHIQRSGWIYNISVSPTNFRTRMKSEYMMSMAMGIEILKKAHQLSKYKDRFSANLSDHPLTDYVSSEFFRCISLELLEYPELIPVGLDKVLHACQAGEGYCDFSISSKIDDYMGVAKRTSRDQAKHSPVSSIHAQYLSQKAGISEEVYQKLLGFKTYLQQYPFDIPAFNMRDITEPFGTDITPLELIAASYILTLE